MEKVFLGKGLMEVWASASDLEDQPFMEGDDVWLARAKTLCFGVERSELSFVGFISSCPSPVHVPSHRSLLGLCLPGLLLFLPHRCQQRDRP